MLLGVLTLALPRSSVNIVRRIAECDTLSSPSRLQIDRCSASGRRGRARVESSFVVRRLRVTAACCFLRTQCGGNGTHDVAPLIADIESLTRPNTTLTTVSDYPMPPSNVATHSCPNSCRDIEPATNMCSFYNAKLRFQYYHFVMLSCDLNSATF